MDFQPDGPVQAAAVAAVVVVYYYPDDVQLFWVVVVVVVVGLAMVGRHVFGCSSRTKKKAVT